LPENCLNEDDEKIIRLCAWRALRGLGPGLTRDDLLQEARVAIWLARSGGRVPQDEVHARRYLAQRAYGAMIDASRQAWSQWPPTVDELSPAHEASEQNDLPDAQAQLNEAMEYLGRVGSKRVNECFDLVSRGNTCIETAAIMGITASGVSKLLHEARKIIAKCF
jgi:RNA polymerase sigma factor (sigma-70 family)